MTYLATFHTHFDAMQYLRFLKEKNVKGALKPVPRKVSSSCGTCVVFDLTEPPDMDEFTQGEVEGLYRLDGKGYTLLFQDE